MSVVEIIFYSITFLVIIFSPYIIIKSHEKYLKPLCKEMEGDIRLSFRKFMPYLNIRHQGVEALVGIKPAGRYISPRLVLKMITPNDFSLVIYKRDLAFRQIDTIFLRRIKTGDSSFDRKYLIKSRDPIEAKCFLQKHSHRLEIDNFFSLGFSSLKTDKKSLIAIKPFRYLRNTTLDEFNAMSRFSLIRLLIRKSPEGVMEDDLNAVTIKSCLDRMEKIFEF